ncbi:hypothetical protein PoB_007414200 [Plakobranchus ocellatus]|uniref:Uncharacterized protein n=1 Tax=Plakobranchus ocellatus TaxID=259542 RepID=A0AAV4DTE8_9GAST|nr:hypothetical protein PoB_007414200 [Plakobranchus ocellatus]
MSSQGVTVRDGIRTRNRRVPADLRADALATDYPRITESQHQLTTMSAIVKIFSLFLSVNQAVSNHSHVTDSVNPYIQTQLNKAITDFMDIVYLPSLIKSVSNHYCNQGQCDASSQPLLYSNSTDIKDSVDPSLKQIDITMPQDSIASSIRTQLYLTINILINSVNSFHIQLYPPINILTDSVNSSHIQLHPTINVLADCVNPSHIQLRPTINVLADSDNPSHIQLHPTMNVLADSVNPSHIQLYPTINVLADSVNPTYTQLLVVDSDVGFIGTSQLERLFSNTSWQTMIVDFIFII